jgi:vacuolar protein sorting-associated protein IST1
MFGLFGGSFDAARLKPHLKMAVNRFGILNKKKAALIKGEKKEIAGLLRDDKEEKARIKVEHVIRSDYTIEAYEILELLCELLHERIKLLLASPGR